MLCRVLMERLPKNVETIYLANPSLARDEILSAIADELKVEHASDRPSRLMRALLEHLIARYAEGRRVVVLIDEAHAMPRETLEEIRLLSNLETNRHKLLQIVLFGQPELDDHLNTAQLRQLMDRITHTFRLEPLVRSDIERYIDFRMRAAGLSRPQCLLANAVRLIADASAGLTRRINILADKSLLAAFAANAHAVTVKEVRRAIRDSEFYRGRKNWRPFALAAAGVAGGLAIGLSVDSLLPDRAPPPTASPAAYSAAPNAPPATPPQTASVPAAASASAQETPAAPAPTVQSAEPAPSGAATAASLVPQESAAPLQRPPWARPWHGTSRKGTRPPTPLKGALPQRASSRGSGLPPPRNGSRPHPGTTTRSSF